MIDFNYLTDFVIEDELSYVDWISSLVDSHHFNLGDITYIFCDDAYLHEMNVKYLNHDTLTDIITFDYTEDKIISGDLFISVQRLKDNSKDFKTSFQNELLRVMSHGVFHLMGYKDKTNNETIVMRNLEDKAISLFHVKQ